MRISDLLRLSLDNLRRRKGRTALTVIGVVVGTCAIVVMISLGIAVNAQNEEMLQSWGDLTMIQMYNYSSSSENALDDALVERIRSTPHVTAVTPYYQPENLNGCIKAGTNGRYETYPYNIYGLDEASMEPMGFALQSGTWLTDVGSLGKNKIPVLVGEEFGYNFEDTKRSYNSNSRYRYSGQTDKNGNPLPPFVDPQNARMTLQLKDDQGNVKENYELVVMGTLVGDYSKDYMTVGGLVMRLQDARKLTAAADRLAKRTSKKEVTYQQINIKVDEVDNVAEVEKGLQDEGYNTNSMTQIREEMQKNVAQSQMILGSLAAISLLVAALNIMNTMTMAIYERTREIGVMKVLGCKLWYIRSMFLAESGAIGLLGGVVGVAISLAISAVLNNLTAIMGLLGGSIDLSGLSSAFGGFGGMGGMGGKISIIPPWLILLALVFATLVGLVSGIAPAGRAVKISSLEAIRHD